MTTEFQGPQELYRIQYECDGSISRFIFPFCIFSKGDILVFLDDVQLNEGFSVCGENEKNGGVVTFVNPPLVGSLLTLVRVLPAQRTSDFQESAVFSTKVLNRELDYLTALIQQGQAEISRCIRLAPFDRDTKLELPEFSARSGGFLAFDGDGGLTSRKIDIGVAASWKTLDDVPGGTLNFHFTKDDKRTLSNINDAVQNDVVRSFSGRSGAIVAAKGDYNADQISETASRFFLLPSERIKLGSVQAGAQVNTVISVYGRSGAITAQKGDYTADDITDTVAKVVMTVSERQKLAGIQAGAQVNATNLDQIQDGVDRLALRSLERSKLSAIESGAQVNTVVSVHGRSGAITAKPGDYTADDISDTSIKVVMTVSERQKLAGIQAGAQVNPANLDQLQDGADRLALRSLERTKLNSIEPGAQVNAVVSVHGRTGAITAKPGDYAADDISDTAAKVVMTVSERQKLAGIQPGAQVNPSNLDQLQDGADRLALRSLERTKLSAIESGAQVNTVVSVHGRTGAINAQPGDYTADDISDTAAKVVMTVSERQKLADVQPGAQVNPANLDQLQDGADRFAINASERSKLSTVDFGAQRNNINSVFSLKGDVSIEAFPLVDSQEPLTGVLLYYDDINKIYKKVKCDRLNSSVNIIDAGTASSTYLIAQNIDGGGANA